MALKIKQTEDNSDKQHVVFQFKTFKAGIPNPPIGLPTGFPEYTYVAFTPVHIPSAPPLDMPEAKLPRVVNYIADSGGCGFWRMLWPEYLLNIYQKANVSSLNCMVMDQRFYHNVKAIRMQRQATPTQKEFIKQLKKLGNEIGFKIIYEVDDIVFKNDIPEYNRCKDAFVSQEIIDSILEITGMVDEITVTCNFMKEYYQDKTNNKKITVIPNYAPKFWLDRFYNRQQIQKNYEKNKKRPRILYSGSGTHVDVLNRTNLNDDFKHITDAIIKARKKFKFVWKGCYPLQLKPYIDNGDMEYIDWSTLQDYPQGLVDTNCNAVFASLQDNIFNKSKSNIKMIESGALGMPGAFQDLCTYEEAQVKFTNGDDLISKLEYITSDTNRYMNLSDKARKYVEGMWLEDHLDKYEAVHLTEWGSKERNEKYPDIIRLNPDQKV
jgi:glycosyltransferase involved in cell wall biosynthesis